ncbi:glyoxalase [Allobacillus sp. SKP2-8]|uniref:VOC family protein n=1 Tax=unclassified Allobacillus TaxID=2628859 RepID=UPI0011821C22|nr:VOC family protein [Allobacillus sp. SKP2-8]TSJ69382.1 glyoxalase [Allobacillus sp. SKP2-8]
MNHMFKKIDHVQLTAPTGSEYEAREFYVGILGMEEVKKPESLEANGGVWFRFGDFELHIGIEEPYTPAKKAHPAFEVDQLNEFIALLEEHKVNYTVDDQLPNANRIYLNDPFGNRLEVLEWNEQ